MTQPNKPLNTQQNRSRHGVSQHLRWQRYLLLTALSVGAAIMTGCSDTQREQAEQTLGMDKQDVFSLQVGTCFNEPDGNMSNNDDTQQVSDVPIRDCSKPHDYEVFHLFDLTGDSLPNEDEIDDQIDDNCLPAFERYVGKSFDDSIYDMSSLSPTVESWQDGDREVACFLLDPDEKQLTESLKGKNM